jgi:hypothetical protein
MDSSSIEKLHAFASAQYRAQAKGKERPLGERPVVTLSRQAGAGGVSVADAVAAYLSSKSPRGAVPWTVFDRNLVEKVLEEHGLPKDVGQFMPEDEHSLLNDAVEDILGLHPSRWRLVHNTTQTVLRLARLGHCVLVGRGAPVVTAHLPLAFHVRLVGSMEARVAHLQAYLNVSARKARGVVEEEDAGRARYMKKYFKRDIDDPTLYHLVLNTDRIPYEEASRIVGDAVLARARQA